MKIFVASHGRFATGIKSSVTLLLGNSERVTAYDAYLDDGTVQEAADIFFEGVSHDETVILMSDLLGGSVNHVLFQYLERPNTYLIATINLALLMELVLHEGDINETVLQDVIENSRQALTLVNTVQEVEEEDFF